MSARGQAHRQQPREGVQQLPHVVLVAVLGDVLQGQEKGGDDIARVANNVTSCFTPWFYAQSE